MLCGKCLATERPLDSLDLLTFDGKTVFCAPSNLPPPPPPFRHALRLRRKLPLLRYGHDVKASLLDSTEDLPASRAKRIPENIPKGIT
jgi:hypothetical protein